VDFFSARYFTGTLGRFNSPDPGNAGADLTNPQSWNGYGYVWGNPLNATDPSGMCSTSDHPPCYQAAATTSAKGDPDFASSTDPYDPFGWISDWIYSWDRLHSGGGGGGGGSSKSQPPAKQPSKPQPPKNNGTQTCVAPSFAQRAIVNALSFLSKRTGRTLGYKTGGSIGAGRKPIAVNYAISMQFVAAPDGTVGKQFSYTPNSASYFSAGTTGYGGLLGCNLAAQMHTQSVISRAAE
jgi:hypothetical protein